MSPALKDRNTEEDQLNPGERHYKERFDDIVGNMRVEEPNRDLSKLESPQASSANSSSSSTGAESRTQATKRDLKSQESVKNRVEQNVGNIANRESTGSWANRTTDKALGKMGATGRAMQILTRMTNRRGSLIATGTGIGALFLALVIPALSPFPVPGIMDLFGNYRGAKLERITERSVERILYQAIASKVGTKGDIVYRPGSPLGTLFATWRTNNFEQRLSDKYGLQIIDAGGSGVRLQWNGQDLGTGRSANDIRNIVNSNGPLLQADIKKIVNQELASWRWMKRAKFANWLKIKYGIPKYGADKSDDSDPDEQRKAVKEGFLRSQYTKYTTLFGSAMDCIFRPTGCSYGSGSTSETMTGERGERAESSVKESVDTAANEVIDDQVNNRPSNGIIAKLASNSITALGVKAIPIVGQIDFAAWMIVLVNEIDKNDLIAQLPVNIKSELAGFIAGMWAGYGDQIKAGELDANSAGVFAEQLVGAEQSVAFNYVSGAGAVGVAMNSWQKINQKRPLGPITDLKEGRVGSLFEGAREINRFNPAWLTTTGIAYAWYYTIGAALNFVGDTVVSFVIDSTCRASQATENFLDGIVGVFTCEDLQREADNMTVAMMAWFIDYIMGSDPGAMGANLANNIDQGLAISNETFCKEELGCGRVEGQEAAELKATALAMQQERFDVLPLRDKIFSHDTNLSVVSQLAMHVPSLSTNSSVLSTLATAAKLPGTALSSLFKPAQATEAEDLYGIWEYDIPEWAFEEIPEEMFTGDPCPDLDEEEKFVSSCRAFLNAVEALEASESGDDGSDFSGGGGSGSGISGDAQELAKKLLELIDESGSSVTFGATSSCEPACVREPFERVARGEKANVPASNTSTNETDVHPDILKVLIAAAEEGIPMRITALTTGTHSARSHHYNGTAVDIGNAEDARRVMPWLFNNRQDLNIYDLFHDPTPQYNINDGSPCSCSIGGHSGHIHIGVTP